MAEQPAEGATKRSAAEMESAAPAADGSTETAAASGSKEESLNTQNGYISRQNATKSEEMQEKIKFVCITNDGQPESMIYLVNLKNIFCRQLPRMPKEYIARLVLDRRHRSMVLLKRDDDAAEHAVTNYTVIGGVCFRPFFDQGFAEIVFLAITNTEQVKGYGTRLMNHLKEHVKSMKPRQNIDRGDRLVDHFLTYADNFAVGYFRKQGFTKEVTMREDRWAGFIKDYEGGTLMECIINRHIDYLDIPGMIKRQKACLIEKIKERSSSHVVYDGYDVFQKGEGPLEVAEIRGLKESGWSPLDNDSLGGSDADQQQRQQAALQNVLRMLLKEIKHHSHSWPFLDPVDTDEITDYLDVIKDPIDLTMIEKRLNQPNTFYKTKDIFRADLKRMVDNCRAFNSPDTVWYDCANILEQFFTSRLEALPSVF